MDTQTNVPEKITFAKKSTVEEYNKQKEEFTQKTLKELNEQMKQLPSSSIIKKNSTKLSMSLPNSDNEQEHEQDNSGNPPSKTQDLENHPCKMQDLENDDSESDYDDNNNDNKEKNKGDSSVNFIIKHYISENSQNSQQLLKKRKINNQNSTQNSTPANQTNTMTCDIYAQHELAMNTITKLKLQNNNLKVENEDLDKKKHFLTLELSNAQCDIVDLKKQVSYLKDENSNLKQFINIMKKTDEKCLLYFKITFYILLLLLIILTLYVFF